MKRVLISAAWLLLFAGLGITLGVYFTGLALQHGIHIAVKTTILYIGAAGAGLGALVFALAAKLHWLPGLGDAKRSVKWGLMQAVWLVLGFMLMQLAGAVGCTFLSALLVRIITTVTGHAPGGGQNGLLASALSGYLTATLWSLWYIGRLGPARVQDGSATGIAWRAAPREAYVTAVLCAAGIIILVIGLVHFFPPDVAALKDLPSVKLFDTSGWPAFVLLGLVVFIAPPVEEFVFRGGIFAALASRCSPFWAGVITTLLFMAVHAPEKIHYPAGFIDVGLMAAAAAWMRIKFNSIRPGILLHLLYNGGLMFAASLAGGG